MPDHLDTDFHVDTDLKTCWDISDLEIKRQISKFGYDIAAAAGLEAVQAVHGWTDASFQWCFVETMAPFDVRFIRLSSQMMRDGQAKWREANRRWAECLKTGVWPGMGNSTLDAMPEPNEHAFVDAERT